MVQKSGNHQYLQGFRYPRWLFGISFINSIMYLRLSQDFIFDAPQVLQLCDREIAPEAMGRRAWGFVWILCYLRFYGKSQLWKKSFERWTFNWREKGDIWHYHSFSFSSELLVLPFVLEQFLRSAKILFHSLQLGVTTRPTTRKLVGQTIRWTPNARCFGVCGMESMDPVVLVTVTLPCYKDHLALDPWIAPPHGRAWVSFNGPPKTVWEIWNHVGLGWYVSLQFIRFDL